MSPCCEPSYRLMRSPHYGQVLTGITPYDDGNKSNAINNLKYLAQPSRPTDPGQNRWMQDRVWDAIVTGWSKEPELRCELSALHHVFLMSSIQDARPEKQGDLNVQTDRSLTVTENSQPSKQGRSNVEKSSPESPLSFSFCEVRSQRSRGLLMKWIRYLPRTLSLPWLTRATASRRSHYLGS